MIPVVVSGGSGSRLWPVSRAKWPKQFCDILTKSLIEETVHRLKNHGPVHFLTVKNLDTLTFSVVRKYSLKYDNVILEPFGCNTAPAIALLCHILSTRGMTNEVVGVFPADHLVAKTPSFNIALDLAEAATEKYDVVTLGIQPDHPATGYGYIEVESVIKNVSEVTQASPVLSFREKPDVSVAKEFLAAKKFFWNAGMFVFRLNKLINVFATLAPQIWNEIIKIKPDMSNSHSVYETIKPISFDYAIMEKLKSQACVPCDLGWSDMGSWDEIAGLVDSGKSNKINSAAEVCSVDSQGNFVFSQKSKMVTFVGCNDLIVADTDDALLIVKRGEAQKVKNVYEKLMELKPKVCTDHNFEHRPWGKFEILSEKNEFKSKVITVNAGEQLSYQSHEKRAEHWIMISGLAEVILNDQSHKLKAGEYIYIPQQAKHRIKNIGREPLKFVEVQTGEYFGEDDITRYQDDYSRV